MGRKMMGMSSPVMEITVDGEQMTIKTSSLLRTVEYKFTLGEEYEEEMPSKTTIKVSNKCTNGICHLDFYITIISILILYFKWFLKELLNF